MCDQRTPASCWPGLASTRSITLIASREGPRLAISVIDLVDANPGLFANLTTNRIGQALTGFDETGQRRIPPLRPGGLPTQQRTILTIGDQHDYRRISTWKVRCAAVIAVALMAGLHTAGGRTTSRTEAMSAVPPSNAYRVHSQ